MTQQEKDALFMLIRYAMGIIDDIPDDQKENIVESIPVIYKESKQHDIAHIVADALFSNGLISSDNEYFEKFKKIQIAALIRSSKMSRDLSELAATFEQEKIPFLPLKGSVTREYYPESWMRIGSDVDVLVKKSDLKSVLSILVDKKGYKYLSKYVHDVSLLSNNNFHIEVHYDLLDESSANNANKVIADIWDKVELKSGHDYWYEMRDEYFYLYHIAHAAKHFLNGGCGIKPFIDLWVLENRVTFDKAKRDELIEKAGLGKFNVMCRELASAWLEAKPIAKKEVELMEEFIIRGGVYGTPLNHMVMQQQKRGGKLGYAMKLFFPSYDFMCRSFPVLEKHKWLTPLFYVVRVFVSTFKGSVPRVLKVLKVNNETPKEIDEAMVFLLRKTGLK